MSNVALLSHIDRIHILWIAHVYTVSLKDIDGMNESISSGVTVRGEGGYGGERDLFLGKCTMAL